MTEHDFELISKWTPFVLGLLTSPDYALEMDDSPIRRALGNIVEDAQKELAAHVAALTAQNQKYEQEIREILWLHHGCVTALYGDDGEMQCGRHRLDFKRQPLDELREQVRTIKWQLLGEAAERAEKEKTEVAAQSLRLQQLETALKKVRQAAKDLNIDGLNIWQYWLDDEGEMSSAIDDLLALSADKPA